MRLLSTSFFGIIILTFLTQYVFSQNPPDYKQKWEEINALEKKGLTASAREKTKTILRDAMLANNNAQQLKATLYLLKYQSFTEEDMAVSEIALIDSLSAQTKTPVKEMLTSLKADVLNAYFVQNNYRIRTRTQLASDNTPGFQTWSADKIKKEINKLYLESISNQKALLASSLTMFNEVFSKGQHTENLVPSVYDFLARHAIEGINRNRFTENRAPKAFSLNDPALFGTAYAFIKLPVDKTDSSNIDALIVSIYQNLLKSHAADASPDAFIDIDLERLNFLYQYSVLPNKFDLMEAALISLEKSGPAVSTTAEVMYKRAEMYYSNGLKYNYPTNTNYKNEIKRCYELLQDIVNKYPNSYGGAMANDLMITIKQPALELSTEKVVIPNEPFKALIEYNNISTVYYRIYRLSSQEMRELAGGGNWNDRMNSISRKKLQLRSNISLPQGMDLRSHRTEIVFDGLPVGNYMIVCSPDSNFINKKSLIYALPMYVSNLAVLYNQYRQVSVVNRSNGQPVPYARVKVWTKDYNSRKAEYEWITLGEELQTDGNGYSELPAFHSDHNNFYFEVTSNNDQLFTTESFYLYNYKPFPAEKNAGMIFTDRTIYRPGQRVFFKGILYLIDSDRKKSVLPFTNTKVKLLDANYKEVKSLKLQTNEFGSYTGYFDIPSSGLTGNFSIEEDFAKSRQMISVEEYKRPKFKVNLNNAIGSYKVGDSIQIKGNALAYSGNNISNAKLVYHITRTPVFPIWWYDYRRIIPQVEGAEIASGEMETDDQGNFTISFKAIADESIDKSSNPTFNYEVNVDVTDINGETRSSSLMVTAGYHSMEITIQSADLLQADSLNQIQVFTKNLSGEFVSGEVTINLLQLVDPNKIYKPRYWEEPDLFVMSKGEHDKMFPNDIYKNEDRMGDWAVLKQQLTKTDSSKASGKFNLGSTILPTGWYKLVAYSIGASGDTTKSEKIIALTDKTGKFNGTQPALSIKFQKDTINPGDKTKLNISAGFKKAYVIGTRSSRDGRTYSYSNLKSNNPESLNIRADSSDLGGISFAAAMVMNNRFYSASDYVAVPWLGKDLLITYESFRDKMEPGAKEKFKLRVTEKVPSDRGIELLANMYDASLDQIQHHAWRKISDLWPIYSYPYNFSSLDFEKQEGSNYSYPEIKGRKNWSKIYPQYQFQILNQNLNYYRSERMDYFSVSAKGAPANARTVRIRGQNSIQEVVVTGVAGRREEPNYDGEFAKAEDVKTEANSNPGNIPVRTNFNETAFFYPQIQIDQKGNASLEFTMPEALTQWKLMTLAHTADLASGYDERFIVTQKKLMVQPNLPRFTREGDRMEIPAKIVNLSDSELSGTAELELFDALTDKPVDGLFQNQFPNQHFTVSVGQSMVLKFPIAIPVDFNSALKWRIKAITNDKSYSDGESDALPVLSNRVLVTETLPMYSSRPGVKKYDFTKLSKADENSGISNFRYTIEYSSNPAWYAVQALPYLMEFPYECAEQTFNRFYANSIASGIINKYPKIKSVFSKWKDKDSSALLSNLEKNQELKSALLEETPWVMQAKNESERKQRIAELFNIEKLARSQSKALSKILDAQQGNGGFSWFNDGPPNRYITQYILSGIGHLYKLNLLDADTKEKLESVKIRGLNYVDAEILKEYNDLKKYKANLSDDNLSYSAIQYLYLRSFFRETPVTSNAKIAADYYKDQAKKYWLKKPKYLQAMIALYMERDKNHENAIDIIRSLKENALTSDEMGMYWAEFSKAGYYWYQAPIESQAMMIEAFSEIEKNETTTAALKTWLLRQKQTQDWGTTKATAEACYALLMQGTEWLQNDKLVTISLGNKTLDFEKAEAGTGYQKISFNENDIVPEMSKIVVDVPKPATGNTSITWGAAYWQFFQDQDKVEAAGAGLSVSKKIMVQKNSDKGPVLVEIKEGDAFHVGDKLKIRLEVRVDRNLEFVHLKDTRAAGLEPGNVLSGYQWQDGLGYYQSTRDASTNFFFQWLPKGTYVFEYPVFVSHNGDFSSGITSLQCMYAPEFSAHSAGQRLRIEE
jgi:uncharacterized protein YfaS (alpha-2-macroglobulin family)